LSLAQGAVVFTLFTLAAGASLPYDRPPTGRVLFVGNSLTTSNDLPRMIEALAHAAGDAALRCDVVAFPNYSLEDHWNRGEAAKAIARGGWTTVVLQQGPSALPESRVLLHEYTRRFDAEIRRAGARTAMYMVWPSTERRGDFDDVKTSYESAARNVGGLLFPVGQAWRAVWKHDPRIELYGSDGFHPTADATYLAALVIYQGLSGRSAAGLAAPFPMPAARAKVLQDAAVEVGVRP
jgi:hypothetical protein